MRERFEVRSLTGYSGVGGPGQALTTSYWVLDHDYAVVVAKFYSPPRQPSPRRGVQGFTRGEQEDRRLAAEARCRALNEQERRWLHSGRWS